MQIEAPRTAEPGDILLFLGQSVQVMRQHEVRLTGIDLRLEGVSTEITYLGDQVKKATKEFMTAVDKLNHIDECVDATRITVQAVVDQRANDRKNGPGKRFLRGALATYRELRIPIWAGLFLFGWWAAIHVFDVPRPLLLEIVKNFL